MVLGLERELSVCKASVSSQCAETVIGTDPVSEKDWLGYFNSMSFNVTWSLCDFMALSFKHLSQIPSNKKSFL